jgi:hypothetical protein
MNHFWNGFEKAAGKVIYPEVFLRKKRNSDAAESLYKSKRLKAFNDAVNRTQANKGVAKILNMDGSQHIPRRLPSIPPHILGMALGTTLTIGAGAALLDKREDARK